MPSALSSQRSIIAPLSPTSVESLMVGTVLLIVYVLSASANLSIAHDSIFYLYDIKLGFDCDAIYHPHHLLFEPLAILWVGLLRAIGCTSETMYLVEYLNGLFGAIGGVFVFRFLRIRFRRTLFWALLGTSLVCFSYGYWFYSSCVEVCIAPAVWFLATMYLATKFDSRLSAWQFGMVVGLLHGVTMLFHQIYVLHGVVLLFLLWRKFPEYSTRAKAIFSYVMTGTLVVVSAYSMIIATKLDDRSPKSIYNWLTLYAHSSVPSGGHFEPYSASTITGVVVGQSRAVTSMLPMTRYSWVVDFLREKFPTKHIDEEVFLAHSIREQFIAPLNLGSIAVALSYLAGVLLVVWKLIRLKYSISFDGNEKTALFGLGLSILVFTLFFSMWDSFNPEFWIWQTSATWMLALIFFSNGESPIRSKVIGLMVALLLFIVNGVGSTLPLKDRSGDFYFRAAIELDKVVERSTGRRSLVILDDRHPRQSYITQFTALESISLFNECADSRDVTKTVLRAKKRIDSTLGSGGVVVVYPGCLSLSLQNGAIQDVLSFTSQKRLQAEIDSLFASYRSRMTKRHVPPEGDLWLMQ